ncbi:germin family protein [Abortiporus biennis]
MLSLISRFTVMAVVLGSPAVAFSSGISEAQEVATLKVANSAVTKVGLLNDTDFVFDFVKNRKPGGAGGTLVLANEANFPILTDNGLAMAVALLEPCGLVTPHSHPRATEMLYSVNGTFTAGFLMENGARFVNNTVNPGEAAIFPKGSIHFEQNELCEPVLFVAGLSSPDPGALSFAQTLFGLPPDVTGAALGGANDNQVADIEKNIPDNIAIGSDECLARCGIKRGSQPTNQRQPRNSGNALPSGYSAPTQQAAAVQPSAAGQSKASAFDVAGNVATTNSDGKPNTTFIILIVIIAVMGVGWIALLALFLVRWRKEKENHKWAKDAKYSKTGAEYAPEVSF